jgi:hypothetical protein
MGRVSRGIPRPLTLVSRHPRFVREGSHRESVSLTSECMAERKLNENSSFVVAYNLRATTKQSAGRKSKTVKGGSV